MSELNCDGELLLLLTFSLFLYHENAQNTVQCNSKFLSFFPGSMPPDPPTSLHLHCSHAPPPPPPTENPGYVSVWNKRRGANLVIYGTYKCVVGLWICKMNTLTLFYLLKLKYNRELRIEKSCPFSARKAAKNVARTYTTTFANVFTSDYVISP